MENCRNMACPVGSLKGTTPVGPLELPEELLQALAGRTQEEGLTNIADLPAVVVGTILSRLTNPFDVAAAFNASRIFWAVRQTVPFRLKLRPSRYDDAFSLARAPVGCPCTPFSLLCFLACKVLFN